MTLSEYKEVVARRNQRAKEVKRDIERKEENTVVVPYERTELDKENYQKKGVKIRKAEEELALSKIDESKDELILD